MSNQPTDKKTILTVTIPVPVPEIKTFSRWRVFLALFDRKAHFTTCDNLQLQLQNEIVNLADQYATIYGGGAIE